VDAWIFLAAEHTALKADTWSRFNNAVAAGIYRQNLIKVNLNIKNFTDFLIVLDIILSVIIWYILVFSFVVKFCP
jgi:hypothetical protein